MLIGEVARRSGVSTRMLRHYESLGLVRPTGRTVGGYREYSAVDIRRIFQVESLRSLGMSLRQIARARAGNPVAPGWRAKTEGDRLAWGGIVVGALMLALAFYLYFLAPR